MKLKWVRYNGGIRSKDKKWSVHVNPSSGRFQLIRHSNKQRYDYGEFDTEDEAKDAAESGIYL